MESTGFREQIGKRIVIYLALAVFIYGVFAYFKTPQAKLLFTAKDCAVNILVLTDTPLFISYNPKYKKAIVTSLKNDNKNLTPSEILAKEGIDGHSVFFIKPYTSNSEDFWSDFKNNLYGWQKQPYKIFAFFTDYAKMRLYGRTNINTADFIALCAHLQKLLPTDFSVKAVLPAQVTRKGAKIQKDAESGPQILLAQNLDTEEEKPILIEVLNASGQSGLAAQATRYLRRLSNDGTLNLDIINFSNAAQREKKTKIIDLSGRSSDLKNIAKYIGSADMEIFRQSGKNDIIEARIILGEDFVLPKK